jgi:hypothetical protein
LTEDVLLPLAMLKTPLFFGLIALLLGGFVVMAGTFMASVDYFAAQMRRRVVDGGVVVIVVAVACTSKKGGA